MELEELALSVRKKLITSLDCENWKNNPTLRNVLVYDVVNKNPDYAHITDDEIDWVMNRVTEMVTIP